MHPSLNGNGTHVVPPPTIELPVNTHVHDPLSHPRDQHGNRVPTSGASTVSTVSPEPVEQTELPETIDEIRAGSPALAALAEHFYNRRLLESIRLAETTAKSVYGAFHARQRTIAERNTWIDCRKAQVEARAAERLEPLEATLAEIEHALREAHLAAARACARIARPYVPGVTTGADILTIEPASLQELAGDIGLAYDPSERLGHVAPHVLTLLSIVVGSLTGVSLGLLTRQLSAQDLFDNPLTFLFFAASGSGLAFAMKCAVEGMWGRVGLFDLVPRRFEHACRFVFSCVLSAGFALADAALEKVGMLSMRAAKTGVATIPGVDALTLYAAPFIIAAPLIVVAAIAGISKKRTAVVENRLLYLQQKDLRDRQAAHTSTPDVHTALDCLAVVTCLLHEGQRVTEKINAREAAVNQEIAELVQARRPLEDDLSPEEKRLIQDQKDQVVGTQLRFDEMLVAFLKATHGRRGACHELKHPGTRRRFPWFQR